MNTLVIAPHPDDELLGCGGTLLRKASENEKIGWVIMTSMKKEDGWSEDRINKRENEIEKVRKALKIKKENVYRLNFSPARLDEYAQGEIIEAVSKVFKDFKPQEIFIPHSGDVHSDHRVCFNAVEACTKWFRHSYIEKVITYETISETDAGIENINPFKPNIFVDISETLQMKWDLLQIYESEIKNFPFPRSEKAIKSLARYRGSQSGFNAAEAFCLLKARIL